MKTSINQINISNKFMRYTKQQLLTLPAKEIKTILNITKKLFVSYVNDIFSKTGKVTISKIKQQYKSDQNRYIKAQQKLQKELEKEEKKAEQQKKRDAKKAEKEKQKLRDTKKIEKQKLKVDTIYFEDSTWSSNPYAFVRDFFKPYRGKTIIVSSILEGETNIFYTTSLYVPTDRYNNWINNDVFHKLFDNGSIFRPRFTTYKRLSQDLKGSDFLPMKQQLDRMLELGIDITQNVYMSGNLHIFEEKKHLHDKTILNKIQKYSKGITHCFFNPIKAWIENLISMITKKTTRDRVTTLHRKLNQINKYIAKYADGLPHDHIVDICNELKISVSVSFPFNKLLSIDCKCTGKSMKHFSYINTKMDHVDFGFEDTILNKSDVECVTRDELLLIQKQLQTDKIQYYFKKDSTNICEIITPEKKYVINNDYKDIINKFEIDNDLHNICIDDISQPELSTFINNGTHYNSTIDFVDIDKYVGNPENLFDTSYLNNRKDLLHGDMTTAYTQFKLSKYYQGFLGKITDFRKTNTIQGVGIYQICNLDFSNCNPDFKKINDKMKIYECYDIIEGAKFQIPTDYTPIKTNTYTSAELNMLSKMGVTYDILAGCWGVTHLDFDFTQEMFKKTDGSTCWNSSDYPDRSGIRLYAKWVGSCDSHSRKTRLYMPCTEDFATILKNKYKDQIEYFSNDEVRFNMDLKHHYHKGHITAFITAYQRLNVIEQLLKMDYDKLVRVCVDGIYHTQKDVIYSNSFSQKGFHYEYKLGNVQSETYVNSKNIYVNVCDTLRTNYKTELFLGAGGCGKTHRNMTDTGLIKPYYISPSWKLARNKKTEYNCNANVWANLVSTDPEKINIFKKYNVLIIDEVSMMTENEKKYIISTYSSLKLIFCGDIKYQLQPFKDKSSTTDCTQFTINNIDKVTEIQYNEHSRTTDKNLLTLLTDLRYFIDLNIKTTKVYEYLQKEFAKYNKLINKDTLKTLYNTNDMILCGTNNAKDEYTQQFSHLEKYYVIKNTADYSNGDIIIGKKPDNLNLNSQCVLRHSYTVHSIQGETAQGNLYIDAKTMLNNNRLFYTALSRAKTIDQIYIII